ncbi:NAD-dependent epimerase/dehydratase family protein [Lysinimonas soli]|uniref:NAD-dependent epimerase/dehydratase family protein n=1 Tax=Lysinimonas soli TaxID=1074233 RepID=A0ABW0NSW0_9MICO
MRIAVTGGSGKLGRGVVAVLREAGHDVFNLDRAPAPGGPARGPGFVEIDLSDYGQVADALSGVEEVFDSLDAVVHLAAIPAPGLASNVATFQNNMAVGYNVFEACRKAGIRRIVHASSETVLGLPFDVPPPYLPVDEEYPAVPNSTYSLVKHLEEQLATQLCRWDPELSVTGLRFSNVMDGTEYPGFPAFDADPQLRRWNLWGYIDVRDAGQAVLKALETRGPGYEAFIIAATDTVMSRSSAELAAEVFPGVPVTKQLDEHETLLSIDKAKRMLGYAPQFSWRDHV